MINVEFRTADKDDQNFILSSYLKGLRQKRSSEYINPFNNNKITVEQGHYPAFMPHDIAFRRLRPIVEEKILPISEIAVAFNPEYRDQIYGYIVYRKKDDLSIISFLYVKQPFRKLGIGKDLLNIAKSKINVATYYAPWLSKAFKNEGIAFDPFFDLIF